MATTGEAHTQRRIEVGGVELHYIDLGEGDPVVLTHGGGQDLSVWRPVLPELTRRYRVIAWSRRYAGSNHNATLDPDYSARTDAGDLKALVQALALGPAHHVAHSIGGVAVLFHAVEHVERVRSLVLSEPPVLRWARGLPGGEPLWQDFLERMWQPAGGAFEHGAREEAMRIVTDYFMGPGTFARLSERSRQKVMRGSRDWEAFQRSSTAFPELSPERVQALDVPALLLSAERTTAIHRLVDDRLAELLPGAERVRIAGASHDMWVDQRDACLQATLDFLARQ